MTEHRPNRTACVLVGLWAAVLLGGCGPSLISITSYRGHRGFDELTLAELARLVEKSVSMKAEVLSSLGPPVNIIGQDDGEIFVYRRVARDTNTIDLNPSYVFPGAPPVTLYLNSDVSGRDDLLMIFFDEAGRLRGASLRRSVADVDRSRAARLGEGMREWIE
jgi:hypothetical protein